MSKLTNFVDSLVETARQQGLSASNDIIYRLAPDVTVILSDNEPTDHVFPLDGVWIISDTASPDYKKVFKRVSKTPANGFQYTWTELSEYDDLMRVQTWDSSDVPTPVIVSGKGGQLEAELLARITNLFGLNEVIPRSYADAIKSSLSSGFSVMLNNINNRTLANTGRLNLLTTTVQLLDAKVDEVSLGSLRGMFLAQTDPTPLWAFAHDFGEGHGFCFCTDLQGEIMWPEKIYSDPESPDTLLAEFLEPVSGYGVMVYVRK